MNYSKTPLTNSQIQIRKDLFESLSGYNKFSGQEIEDDLIIIENHFLLDRVKAKEIPFSEERNYYLHLVGPQDITTKISLSKGSSLDLYCSGSLKVISPFSYVFQEQESLHCENLDQVLIHAHESSQSWLLVTSCGNSKPKIQRIYE